MKKLYPTLLALSFLAFACRDSKDTDTVTPAKPAVTDPTEAARVEVEGWLTSGPWNVDSLSVKVFEAGKVVGDTAYTGYGTYRFEKDLPALATKLAGGAKYLVHIHPDLTGKTVTDSMGYWVGNTQTGEASRNFLTLWRAKMDGTPARIYTQKAIGKNQCRYENRITLHTSTGKEQIWVRRFVISH